MKKLCRRTFLQHSAATTATTLVANRLWAKAEPKPTTIGLGFSLYGMKSLTIDAALKACAEIGYDCVELPVMSGWPGDTKQLSAGDRKKIRQSLQATGLRMSAIMENLHASVDDTRHRANLERLKLAGELGHQLSPKNQPVIETILGGRPNEWEKTKHRMAERLLDWAKVAEASRTVVAIKAHVGGAMHRPEHPVWMAKQVSSPWIRCAYDYSHFELRDIDMAQSVRTLVPPSAFIHVKDSRGDASHVQFLLPGQGKINYVTLLRQIAAAGYRNDIFVEVSGQIHGRPGYKPIHAAQTSYTHLAPAFEKAGLRRG